MTFLWTWKWLNFPSDWITLTADKFSRHSHCWDFSGKYAARRQGQESNKSNFLGEIEDNLILMDYATTEKREKDVDRNI